MESDPIDLREVAPTIFWGGKDRKGESRTPLIA
jgi:hypothetical protein